MREFFLSDDSQRNKSILTEIVYNSIVQNSIALFNDVSRYHFELEPKGEGPPPQKSNEQNPSKSSFPLFKKIKDWWKDRLPNIKKLKDEYNCIEDSFVVIYLIETLTRSIQLSETHDKIGVVQAKADDIMFSILLLERALIRTVHHNWISSKFSNFFIQDFDQLARIILEHARWSIREVSKAYGNEINFDQLTHQVDEKEVDYP